MEFSPQFRQIDQSASTLLLSVRFGIEHPKTQIQRICFLLPLSTLSEIMGNKKWVTRDLRKVPISTLIPHYPTFLKISALLQVENPEILFRSLGFENARRRAEAAHAFYARVEKITFGMVTSHFLNHANTLRMLLLAEYQRNSSSVEEDKRWNLGDGEQYLEEFFIYWDQFLTTGWSSSLIGMKETLPKIKTRLLEAFANPKISEILSLFETCVEDPLVYIPELLRPLQRQRLYLPFGDRWETMNPKIYTWLNQFHKACEIEYGSFFTQLSRSLKRSNEKKVAKKVYVEAKNASDAHLAMQKALTDQLYTMVMALQPLEWEPRRTVQEAEWKKVTESCFQFDTKFAAFNSSQSTLIQKIRKVTEGRKEEKEAESWLWGTLKFSHQQFENLVRDVLCCIGYCHYREDRFDHSIKKYITSPLRELSQLTLLDLFQIEIAKGFVELDPKEREPLGELHSQIQAIFSLMRHCYQTKSKDDSVTVATLQVSNWAEKLEKNSQDSKTAQYLKKLKKIMLFFNFAFATERWPLIFFHNPFAKTVSDATENKFFQEIFEIQRQLILTLDFPQSVKKIELVLSKIQAKPLSETIRGWVNKLVRVLTETQEKLKNQNNSSHTYVATMNSCFHKAYEMGEELHLIVDEYEEQNPNSLTELKGEIGQFIVFLASLYQVGEPFYKYVNLKELLEEEQREVKRKKTPPPQPEKAVTQPVVPPTKVELPPPQVLPPPPALGTFDELKQYCEALIPYCSDFIPVSQPLENGLSNEGHQQEHLTNLIEALNALEELSANLSTRGDHPAILSMLYLKLAVALEQSAKLAIALHHIPVPVVEKGYTFLETRGRESLWKNHAPHIFTELLKNSGKLKLKEEQDKLLLQMEKVVAISSRYSASGRDVLTQAIEALFKLDQMSQDQQIQMLKLRRMQAEKLLKTGLETCLEIVKSASNSSLERKTVEKKAPDLIPIEIGPKTDFGPALQNKFKQIERRLQRIQYSQLFTNKTIRIDAEEETLEKRKGTIRISLQDLQANLRLLKETVLMQNPETIPLAFTESLLLRQSVLLERLLLIHLARRPIPSQLEPSQHYLWEAGRRTSHALRTFLMKLSTELDPLLLEQTELLAERLEPFLKHDYRYQGKGVPLLEPFKITSQRLLHGLHDVSYTTALLEKERKRCLDFLEVMEKWLILDEKFLM